MPSAEALAEALLAEQTKELVKTLEEMTETLAARDLEVETFKEHKRFGLWIAFIWLAALVVP